jgi:hypothetical protein
MKKNVIKILLFCSAFSFAQNINDAMRYSQTDLSGTARFTGMSGAFGSLGADLSAVNLNPAGSVFFNNNHAGLTLRSFNVNNNSTYYGTKNSEIKSSVDISQAGGVFVFESAQKSDWSKIAFTLNYESTSNLDNSIYSSGTAPYSIGNYFLSYANGIPLDYLQNYYFEDLNYNQQQAYLGYQAYVINPLVENNLNTDYYSAVPSGANYTQRNEFASTGFNGKLTLNGAVRYKDLFSIGLNINSNFVDYTQSTSFYESNDFSNTTTNYLVKRLRFNNELYTYGTGLSFQLGTIITPIKQFRLGLAYQSPTWYKLNDEFSQSLLAVSSNVDGELPIDVADPQVILIYEPYRVRTAGHFSASMAYLFGKRGLISFDYLLQNNTTVKLGPNSDFAGENDYISNVLRNANQFRIGAEYKIQKFSLRGGYRFEESPYKNGRTIGDLTGYSGGIGYNFGKIKLDASYAYAQRFYDQQFFSQGFTNYSTINTKNHSISTTLTFEF